MPRLWLAVILLIAMGFVAVAATAPAETVAAADSRECLLHVQVEGSGEREVLKVNWRGLNSPALLVVETWSEDQALYQRRVITFGLELIGMPLLRAITPTGSCELPFSRTRLKALVGDAFAFRVFVVTQASVDIHKTNIKGGERIAGFEVSPAKATADFELINDGSEVAFPNARLMKGIPTEPDLGASLMIAETDIVSMVKLSIPRDGKKRE